MKVLLVLPLLVACAHAGAARSVSDLSTQYEVAMTTPAVDAPLPPEYSGTVPPCVASSAAPVAGSACMEAEVSPDEAAAFHAEAMRLAGHAEETCRKLGDAIQNHLSGVRMYDRAIVRRSGPYRFYGVGHSYQSNGEWMIRLARRLDELNERTIDAKARTLRHEISHTLGAKEQRRGEEWSAADYAERCG
ncbi:MAG TPA: hypothetical protein VES88_00210 [Gemmatimonadaceae bacterium]|nr:hypothetical protein [Gemmatimonadaceae bacterium]